MSVENSRETQPLGEKTLKIFVTGASGFIGQHLVSELQSQGHELLLLSNNRKLNPDDKTQILSGNLDGIKTLKKQIAEYNPNITIHLAWQGIPDFSAKMSVQNLHQGLNLMSTISGTGCQRILFVGSLWEYGNKTGIVSEETPTVWDNPFRAAKNALNTMSQHIAKESGVTFIWARIFYVYGPGQKSTSLIPNTIRAAQAGEPLPINNPQSKHDFVYVGDVAKALALLSQQAPAGEYNIGSGELVAVYQIVNKLVEALNLQSPFSNLLDDGSSGMQADISKIYKHTGWLSETKPDFGILKTLASLK